MRQLSAPRVHVAGFTLIELMVTLTLMALLAGLGLPAMAEFLRNSRLREAASVTHATVLFARGEAIKRNERLSVIVGDRRLSVTASDGEVLRSVDLSGAIQLSAMAIASSTAVTSFDFGGAGRPVPFGATFQINVLSSSQDCDADRIRCPRLIVQSGGAIKTCSMQVNC